GLLIAGMTARAQPMTAQSDSGKQSEKATKSVSGKVTSIRNAGASFALQVDGSDKQEMEFVVTKNTQVQGEVKTGTLVTVEYQPGEGGQNLAVTITARG